MNSVSINLDLFKKFPAIQEDVRKITRALDAQNAGLTLQQGFLPYVLACDQLIAKTAKIASTHKDLGVALRALSERVRATYAKIAPSDLMKAIQKNDGKTAAFILKISDLSHEKLPNGQLPLHFAIRMKSGDIVKNLCQSVSLNPLQLDNQKLTAFQHAQLANDPEMIAHLLSGALKSEVPESALSEAIDPVAVQQIFLEVQRLKALPSLNPPIQNWHPIHRSAFLGDIDILKKHKDLNLTDLNGMTALHFALLGGQEEVVHWLLANKAKVDIATKSGLTPLHMASISGSVEALKALLATKKCDPNISDHLGRVPLHFAFCLHHFDAAQVLLSNKADLFPKSMKMTPFAIFKEMMLSDFKDPLSLDRSSLLTFAAFASGAAISYLAPKFVPKIAAIPILGKLAYHAFFGQPQIMRLPFLMGLGGYLDSLWRNDKGSQMVFEGVHTALLATTWSNQMKICWESRALETYRPIRNAFIHTANFLFSGWEFLQVNGFVKQMVCRFGSLERCIRREDVQPLFSQRPECKEVNHLPSDFELKEACKNTPELKDCKKTIWEHWKRVLTQCHKSAQNDAEMIMGFGGYPEKSLKKAYHSLRSQYPCKNSSCKNSKIEMAFDILRKPPEKLPDSYIDPCDQIPNDLLASGPARLLALNPSCPNQASMIFNDCKTNCKKEYRKLMKIFHPDKCRRNENLTLELKKLDSTCTELADRIMKAQKTLSF